MNHHSGTSSSKNSESNNVMMNADGGQNGIEMNKARQKVKLTVGLQVIWSTHVGVHSNHSMKRNEQMNSNESASSATNIATTSSKQDKQDKQDKQEKHEKYDKHDKHEKNKKSKPKSIKNNKTTSASKSNDTNYTHQDLGGIFLHERGGPSLSHTLFSEELQWSLGEQMEHTTTNFIVRSVRLLLSSIGKGDIGQEGHQDVTELILPQGLALWNSTRNRYIGKSQLQQQTNKSKEHEGKRETEGNTSNTSSGSSGSGSGSGNGNGSTTTNQSNDDATTNESSKNVDALKTNDVIDATTSMVIIRTSPVLLRHLTSSNKNVVVLNGIETRTWRQVASLQTTVRLINQHIKFDLYLLH